MNIKEIMAKILYPEHLEEKALEFVEKDIRTGEHLYSASEMERVAKAVAEFYIKEALEKASNDAEIRWELNDAAYIHKESITECYPSIYII